jgi:hypothetical protein
MVETSAIKANATARHRPTHEFRHRLNAGSLRHLFVLSHIHAPIIQRPQLIRACVSNSPVLRPAQHRMTIVAIPLLLDGQHHAQAIAMRRMRHLAIGSRPDE